MRLVYIILTFLLHFLPSELYAYSTVKTSPTYLSTQEIINQKRTTTSIAKVSDNVATTAKIRTMESFDHQVENTTSKKEDLLPTIGSVSAMTMGVRAARGGLGKGGPIVGAKGGGVDIDQSITINMPVLPVMPVMPVMPDSSACEPPMCITIPPLPTSNRPSTIPTTITKHSLSTKETQTTRQSDIVSSSSSSSPKGPTTYNSGTTDINPGSQGGLSTMAAFMLGLAFGVSGLLIAGGMCCVWYFRMKKERKNKYRVSGNKEEEPQQYMQLAVSPGQAHVVSGSMQNHSYEEALMTPPVLPRSPTVPSRVAESRYSAFPDEVLSKDGYATYRASDSEQSPYEDPQTVEAAAQVFVNGRRSVTLNNRTASTAAYAGLNNVQPRRPTIISQDGYAEYIDEGNSKQDSYAELNSCNTRDINPPLQISRAYTQYRPSDQASNYTDLTTGQKATDGYTRYNASIHHQQKSTYTDLRTGQDRRLPSPPTDNGVIGIECLTHRHASVGSIGSMASIKEETLDNGCNASNGHLTVADILNSRGRRPSSVSNDSGYTIPNGITYEEVGPDITSPHNLQLSPTIGVYIDLDEFFEGTENGNSRADVPMPGSETCVNPQPEDNYYFKFQQSAAGENTDSQNPYYFKVDGLNSRSCQIADNNNKEVATCSSRQSVNESPYYFRVGTLGNEDTQEMTNGQTQQMSINETPDYFQLENSVTSSVFRNTEGNHSNEAREQVPASTKRTTSVSLPISDDVNPDYQHLVRSLTLPPLSTISEGSHYEQLKRDNKV